MDISKLIEKTFEEDEGSAQAAYELYRYFQNEGNTEKAEVWLERAQELGLQPEQRAEEAVKEDAASFPAEKSEAEDIRKQIKKADKIKDPRQRAEGYKTLISLLENRPEYSSELYRLTVKTGQLYVSLAGNKKKSAAAKEAYRLFQNASELRAAEEDPDQFRYLMECRRDGTGCDADRDIYLSLLTRHLRKISDPLQMLKEARKYESSEPAVSEKLLRMCMASDDRLCALAAGFRLQLKQSGKKTSGKTAGNAGKLFSAWIWGDDIFKVLDQEDAGNLMRFLSAEYERLTETEDKRVLAERAADYYYKQCDRDKTVNWAAKAAKLGSRTDRMLLYSADNGIMPPEEMIREEAENGNLKAMEFLGRECLKNHDTEGALNYFEKASGNFLFSSQEQYGQILLEKGNTEEALRMFKAAAKMGNLNAVRKLIAQYSDGARMPLDSPVRQEYMKYVRRAADLGDREYTLSAGKLCLENEYYAKASGYLDACGQDNAEALYLIGEMIYSGRYSGKFSGKASDAMIMAYEKGYAGIEKQIGDALLKEEQKTAAEEWYKKAFLEGSAEAGEALFDLYQSVSDKTVTEEKISVYESELRKGNEEALIPLADMYLKNGRIEETIDLYRSASEKTSSLLSEKLGDYYYKKGNRDPEKALHYYEKAVSDNNPKVNMRMAKLLWENGDYEKAAGYYEKAAHYDCNAGAFIGRQYLTGRHIRPSLSKAVSLLKEAAAKNNHDAVQMLTDLYLDRTIVPDSDMLGIYEKAVRQGITECAFEAAEKYWNQADDPQDRVRALEYYRIAADEGNAEAQRITGICYLKGTYTKSDHSQAHRYLSMAAEQSDREALYYLGTMAEDGIGAAKNMEEAFRLYLEAAQKGYRPALKKTAFMYLDGIGTEENPSEAMKYLEQLSEWGDMDAMYREAMVLIGGNGTVPADRTRALGLLSRLKDLNYPEAFTALGVIYLDGIYVKKDPDAAEQLLKKGMACNDTTAMFRLADLYDEKGDYEKSFRILHKLAGMGVSTAYFTLADRFRMGIGTNPDMTAAQSFYQLSAQTGNAYAYMELAHIAETDSARKNAAAALNWYKMAAEAGLAAGYEKMAECHEYGRGTVFDIIKAVNLYNTALTGKNIEAGLRLAGIYRTGKGGIEPDMPLAEATYQETADLGSSEACAALADIYMNEPGYIDYGKAYIYAKQGAESGSAACMLALAKLYNTGAGVKKDRVEALKWAAKAGSLKTGRKINEALQPENPAGTELRRLTDEAGAAFDDFAGKFGKFWRKD